MNLEEKEEDIQDEGMLVNWDRASSRLRHMAEAIKSTVSTFTTSFFLIWAAGGGDWVDLLKDSLPARILRLPLPLICCGVAAIFPCSRWVSCFPTCLKKKKIFYLHPAHFLSLRSHPSPLGKSLFSHPSKHFYKCKQALWRQLQRRDLPCTWKRSGTSLLAPALRVSTAVLNISLTPQFIWGWSEPG